MDGSRTHACPAGRVVERPRFRGQLSAGLSGPAERLSGHAKEAEVPYVRVLAEWRATAWFEEGRSRSKGTPNPKSGFHLSPHQSTSWRVGVSKLSSRSKDSGFAATAPGVILWGAVARIITPR
jgi:hypothetical protein